MSDNNENSQPTALGTIGSLVNNNPLTTDPSKDEDDQKRINDLESESITPTDQTHHHRKSLADSEEVNSAPAMLDPSSNHQPQGPMRSTMSESVLLETSENLPTTLPIQQDETSTDDDDDQPAIIQSEFAERSQAQNRSRTQSASNKRPPSGHAQLSDDADHEVANILRRSPAQENSRQTPTDVQSKRIQSPSSTSSKNRKEEPKQTVGPLPTAIISPASRRESTNKADQQPSSRVSSARKPDFNDYSTESLSDKSSNDFFTTKQQSKLIKPGEQLQIPTDDINTQRLNSPPPSPSTTKQMDFNPSVEETEQKQSRPESQVQRKSSASSNSHQQNPIISDHKPSSTASSRKESIASENAKNDSRRSSTNANILSRASANQDRVSPKDQRQSPVEKRSVPSSRKNSSKTAEQTVVIPMKLNSSKSRQSVSTTDTEHEKLTNSKLPHIHSSSPSTTPTNDRQPNAWSKQAPVPQLPTTEDETPRSRPQSPNVEQIAERNPPSSSSKKRISNQQKKKGQRRSNSAESFNRIPLVDDQSLDSTSGNNTESDRPRQRSVKSKTKDVETNTDSRNGNHQQQQQETTSVKANKSMPDQSPSIRRRIPSKNKKTTTPDTEPDSNTSTTRRPVKKPKTPNEDKDPIDAHLAALDDQNQQRRALSDTEQIVPEKRKKRRRPKRISRTTQTYECVFRRMEREEHEELRPTTDTDKNIQTRQSCLRPKTRSPKRHHPLYVASNAFKIEEILPKQLPVSQRSTSKTPIIGRSNSPQGGKLLILRPTLPFHHSDAVNVQRINLQYAIELIPNESKPNDNTSRQRRRSYTLKQSEQTNNLPLLRSSSPSIVNQPPAKPITKDKTLANKIEDRTYQRKSGGAV